MKPQTYGLSAPPLVQWLLQSEPDVKRAVQDFIQDAGPAAFQVAGPLRDNEVYRFRQNQHAPVALPTITLIMRKVKHHLTGQPGVEVKTARDEDLDELAIWHRQAGARRARFAKGMN